jgi:hypothetical protein
MAKASNPSGSLGEKLSGAINSKFNLDGFKKSKNLSG